MHHKGVARFLLEAETISSFPMDQLKMEGGWMDGQMHDGWMDG